MKRKLSRVIASAVEFSPLESRLLMCLTLDDPDHCADCAPSPGSPAIPSAVTQRTLAKSKLGHFMSGSATILPDSPVVAGGVVQPTSAANIAGLAGADSSQPSFIDA